MTTDAPKGARRALAGECAIPVNEGADLSLPGTALQRAGSDVGTIGSGDIRKPQAEHAIARATCRSEVRVAVSIVIQNHLRHFQLDGTTGVSRSNLPRHLPATTAADLRHTKHSTISGSGERMR